MGTRKSSSRPGRPPTGRVVQTCEIVWWRGYVKGCFQAWMQTRSGPPQLVAESKAIRWRDSSPPDETPAAAAALDTLIDRLTDQGWELTEQLEEPWYGYVFSRLADEEEEFEPEVLIREHVREPVQVQESAAGPLRPVAVEAVTTEVVSERKPDVQTEDAGRPLESEDAAAPAPRPRRSALLHASYALAVVVAAAIFLVGLHSTYAAAVAALTTAALSLGLDSWLVARGLS
jgi:hypothetical protein